MCRRTSSTTIGIMTSFLRLRNLQGGFEGSVTIMSPKNRSGKRKLKQAFANHISAIAQSEDGKPAVSVEDEKTSAAAAVLLDADKFPEEKIFQKSSALQPSLVTMTASSILPKPGMQIGKCTIRMSQRKIAWFVY